MRIALVCPYSWTRPGGVQSHVRGLPRELRRRGHHVDVIAPADRRVAAKSVHVVGPSVPIPDNGSLVPVALTPLAPLRVARLLRARRYEVVHVHEPMIPAVSLSALASASGPLVGTFHMYATRPRWYQTFARLCRTMLGRLDVRIAVSEPARWHVRRICPGDYRIIPNGIDTERYARQRPMGRGSRIVFIGRAERRKGLAVLVDAVARLPAGVELDVVGAGVDAVDPGSRQRVHAHGRVSDEARDRLLTRADVLCVPSLEGESFGIVVLEGMAAGLPVVASELPGYAELLPRSAGRLVPPGDPVALADALREILEDADLREHMGRAGTRPRVATTGAGSPTRSSRRIGTHSRCAPERRPRCSAGVAYATELTTGWCGEERRLPPFETSSLPGRDPVTNDIENGARSMNESPIVVGIKRTQDASIAAAPRCRARAAARPTISRG